MVVAAFGFFMPSSLLDTALFFFLAFAYTDVPWLSLAIGDFAVKAAMALLLLPSYRLSLALGGIMSDLHFAQRRMPPKHRVRGWKSALLYCPPLP